MPKYASRFPGEDDAEALAIGRAARERGNYTVDEFRTACRWKTPRSGPLVTQNSADVVEASTRIVLIGRSGERGCIDALRPLRGVEWATASVPLHLVHPERYSIPDRRALHALGVRARSSFSFSFGEGYVAACRRLAEQAGADGRTLDQAPWQWSKEQGVPLGSGGTGRPEFSWLLTLDQAERSFSATAT